LPLSAPDPARVLVVCTGNTCRSVMAAVMLEHLARRRGVGVVVSTAGTHAAAGVPPGARTLAALRTVRGLRPALAEVSAAVAGHRSRPLAPGDLRDPALVLAMEAGHVRTLRRRHPEAATRTGLLRTVARDLAPGDRPLAARVAALGLEYAVLEDVDDVTDPAGHDDAAYAACAAELWSLCRALVRRL